MPRFLLVALTSVVPLAIAFLVWRLVSRQGQVSRGRTALVVGLALLAGLGAGWLERVVLTFADLSFDAARAGTTGALLAPGAARGVTRQLRSPINCLNCAIRTMMFFISV